MIMDIIEIKIKYVKNALINLKNVWMKNKELNVRDKIDHKFNLIVIV